MKKDRKIYVKFDAPKTPKLFLKKFFCKSPSHLTGSTTYRDKECKKYQCSGYTNRSFEEVYLILKTYYPKITRKDVIHELVVFNKPFIDNMGVLKRRVLQPSFCETINKPVLWFSYYSLPESWRITQDSKGRQKHSWKELFEMIGIRNSQDFNAYRYKYIK